MKKITLFLAAVLLCFVAQAQFHVTTIDGDPINADDVFEYTTTDTTAELGFYVYNDTENPIDMRVKVVSITNGSGDGMQLCFGQCYYGVLEGATYPVEGSEASSVTIQPGQHQGSSGDHIWVESKNGIPNINESSVYVLEFQQMDPMGLFVQESMQITYIYTSALSVAEHAQDMAVQLQSTMINNGKLAINAERPAQMQVYNLLGQEVKAAHLASGLNTVDVSSLSAQVYLVRFQNAKGQTKTQKIVIE